MTFSSNTYNKQNSLLDIRPYKTLKDIVPRIRNLESRLYSLPLSKYKKKIIQSACSELLNETSLEVNITPFRLFSYNLDEINKLEDADLPRYLFYRYRYDIFPQGVFTL